MTDQLISTKDGSNLWMGDLASVIEYPQFDTNCYCNRALIYFGQR